MYLPEEIHDFVAAIAEEINDVVAKVYGEETREMYGISLEERNLFERTPKWVVDYFLDQVRDEFPEYDVVPFDSPITREKRPDSIQVLEEALVQVNFDIEGLFDKDLDSPNGKERIEKNDFSGEIPVELHPDWERMKIITDILSNILKLAEGGFSLLYHYGRLVALENSKMLVIPLTREVTSFLLPKEESSFEGEYL